MIDREKFPLLPPLAQAWAQTQEALILKFGAPLGARQLEDARRVGVQAPELVRVLVVDRIPMPDDPELAEAARRAQVITEASRVVTIGYGILLRADSWQNRELLVHALVHVAQCERAGSLEAFVAQYLSDRASCANFSIGALEEEARRVAREICASN